ncbi:hypothetical protein D9M68_651350 [compost metagenome]
MFHPAVAERELAILFYLQGVIQAADPRQFLLDGAAGQFQQAGQHAGLGGAQAGNRHQFLGRGAQQAPQAAELPEQLVT